MLMLSFFGLVWFSSVVAEICLTGVWCEFGRNGILQQLEVYLNSYTVLLSGKKRKLLLALTENIYWVFLEDSQWGRRKTYSKQNGHWWDIFSIFLCPHWIALIYFMIFPLRCSVGTLMFLLSVWRKLDSWVLIKIWLKPRSTGEFRHSDYEFQGCSSSHLLAHNHSFEWCLHFFKP